MNILQSSSIQKLYEKIAKGEVSGFTVPAFNIRTLTFDTARALFRAAKKEKTGAFIIELARSEIAYTEQSPEEYKEVVLEAAKKEKFHNPIFLQGDHFKIKKERYFSRERPNELKDLENLIKSAVSAGFYNIDIDCSSLPLEENALETAKFSEFIRKLEPENTTISIGGEVGEIGGRNTTIEELRQFIVNLKHLSRSGLVPIIKAAVQTGTSHGKGGQVDFELLQNLSLKAKEYGLAGVVQHGASTLPEKQFERFPKSGTLEIHLASEVQNIIFKSPYFPEDLKQKVTKETLGKFKKEINIIPQKNISKICEELEEKFKFFFRALKVCGTRDLIKEIYTFVN